MILIDGKKIAAELREELKQEVSELKAKHNKVPGLTVILIGDMAPSQIYVRNKEKSADIIAESNKQLSHINEVFHQQVGDLNAQLHQEELKLQKDQQKIQSLIYLKGFQPLRQLVGLFLKCPDSPFLARNVKYT